ncbi:MAG: DUF3592 domain-containing protein [Agriterribacter sp.]
MIGSIVLILFSIILLYVSFSQLQRYSEIVKHGQETEGIIFDIDSSDNFNTKAMLSYPVVRFLTEAQQWVTEKSSVSILPGSYKRGQKITVIYRKEKPTDFFIKASNTRGILIAIIVAAIIFFGIGIYLLLRI